MNKKAAGAAAVFAAGLTALIAFDPSETKDFVATDIYVCQVKDVCAKDAATSYKTIEVKIQANDDGSLTVPPGLGFGDEKCIILLGDPSEACHPMSACEKDCDKTDAVAVRPECGCWNKSAGECLREKEQIPRAVVFDSVSGPGCVAAPCVELDGDQGKTFPAECQ